MARKGLIVVEQMPVRLVTPTSQELSFRALLVLSRPLTAPAFYPRTENKGNWHLSAL